MEKKGTKPKEKFDTTKERQCESRNMLKQALNELIYKKRGYKSCPIKDDVKYIWETVWGAEILLLYIPTYGGLPSALWVALSQRSQGIRKNSLKVMMILMVMAMSGVSSIAVIMAAVEGFGSSPGNVTVIHLLPPVHRIFL